MDVAFAVEGATVRGTLLAPKRARGVALLLHGFNSSRREFGDLPQHLCEAGYVALAIDLRGHGTSDGERGLIGLDRALHDIQAAVAFLKEHGHKQAPVLIGHSLGGAYALGAAPRVSVRGVIACSPPASLMEELDPASRVAYHIVGKMGRRRQRKGKSPGYLPRFPRYSHLFVDPAAAKQAKDESFLQRRANIAGYTFAATMDAEAWAAKVAVPVLGIWSPHDQTVKPAHTRRVFEAVSNLTLLEHAGGHSAFRDLDRERVTEGIIAFLDGLA